MTTIVSALLFALLAASSPAVSIPKSIPSDAPNCALEGPPESAGEVVVQDSVSRVYPRLPDIGPKYKGCQMTWVSVGEEMILASVVYFKKGQPSLMWSQAFEDEKLVCKYKKERLASGPAGLCPVYEQLPVPSMPAGCAEKLSSGSATESQCAYE